MAFHDPQAEKTRLINRDINAARNILCKGMNMVRKQHNHPNFDKATRL